MPFEIDCVRLGDTNLLVEVERDEASPGDETLWGFGKTSRSTRICTTDDAVDGSSSPTPAARAAGHG